MTKQIPTLCIYHGSCQDGFGAAFVIWKTFGGAGYTRFFAGMHGGPLPEINSDDHVYLVDFSYPLDQLQQIIDKAASVTIIDHHKTAQADVQPLLDAGKIQGIFDMDKSGALLTWEYLYPEHEPSKMIQYISDRDLWRFIKPDTKFITAALFSYPYDFNVWRELEDQIEYNPEKMIMQGQSLERGKMKQIEELLGMTRTTMKIGGQMIPVANLPYNLASDACNIMAKDPENKTGMAASYFDSPTKRKFSVRSIQEVDVSGIAKTYGGGGHKNAAGFEVPLNWRGEE